MHCILRYSVYAHPLKDRPDLIPIERKKQMDVKLSTSLFSVLSVRLREGFTLRNVILRGISHTLCLVLQSPLLPWAAFYKRTWMLIKYKLINVLIYWLLNGIEEIKIVGSWMVLCKFCSLKTIAQDWKDLRLCRKFFCKNATLAFRVVSIMIDWLRTCILFVSLCVEGNCK